MTTDSQFAVYASWVANFNPPEWMLNGQKEWYIEKGLRLGYLAALADITGRKFEVGDSMTTTIEKEREELAKKRPEWIR